MVLTSVYRYGFWHDHELVITILKNVDRSNPQVGGSLAFFSLICMFVCFINQGVTHLVFYSLTVG